MNRWQKEVQQSLLDSEAATIKELEKQYAAALKDINEKVKLFQADIDLLDQALSEDGLDDAARARLQSVKRSKVYQQRYQQALKGQVSSILDKMHGDNYATIDKYLNGCYETGFIGTLYDIAGQGIPIIAPIDQTAVIKAILTDSKVSNGLYKRLGVDVAKLKKTITQEISRGIASGLLYRDIARNIRNVSGAPLSRAKTIARTEGHRIQQTSTRDAQYAAKKKGADIVKQWDATLDGRTRDSHRMVDGEIRELDEEFSNGLMFPGDPSGSAAEVVNCRCTSDTRARWALDDGFLKRDNYTGEVLSFESPKDYAEFKKWYWSKENVDYMKYVDTLEKRYGTKDFNALLNQMTDREYQHFHKLENASPMWKKKAVSDVGKMASSDFSNDWSQTVAKALTKQEKAIIVEYAADKGIKIGSIKSFDGDAKLLKAEIDTINKLQKVLPLGKAVTISVSHLADDDFAETIQTTITINSSALRNRKITLANITSGKMFASSTVEDIAAHEYGHIYTQIKGNKGLEIAAKAYYNVFGESVSNRDLLAFLYEHVSPYSVQLSGKNKYKEIIPEILAKNNSQASNFTDEFVKLLKEG